MKHSKLIEDTFRMSSVAFEAPAAKLPLSKHVHVPNHHHNAGGGEERGGEKLQFTVGKVMNRKAML